MITSSVDLCKCIDFDGRNAVFCEWLSENGDCLSGTVRIL